jgi:uncharacterized protein (DUF4415 family)
MQTIKTKSGRTIRLPSDAEDAAIQRGIKSDADAREWTDEMFKQAVPFSALPESLQTKLRAVRGKGKKPAKVQTAFRLDPDVLAQWRASGPGWQTRAAAVLAAHAP